ncbi:MAG: SusC/RagA family TonB-linked outer membrane protein [Candidatus Pseudobacter hemicellulosilyticus]|uniref:SusC/RagA family TonB-linked outer membrane protein n=1 Tax=Candidatus Pseudobacter hemicellulosilyticus TaxID=3121375 RepID=A0AAJ5WX18_9BACT|nr:MAG: SusC/RagA family TonB-linked outer membrane protein [Pseudobacter sp.]
MRVSFAFCFITLCSLQLIWAKGANAQTLKEVSISLTLHNQSLEQAFKQIEQRTPFRFAYRKTDVQLAPVSIDVRMTPVNEILDLLLKGSRLQYEQADYSIFIRPAASLPENTIIEKGITSDTAIVIRGKVMSSDNTPLAGAVVTVKGTRFGTAANANGNFEIRDVPMKAVLVFSFVGYREKEMPVTGETNFFLVKMEEAGNLSEVTVVSTGYQNLPKERATGSFAIITAKELEKIPTANLIQRIEGLATGLQPKIMAGDNSFLYQGLTQGIRSETRNIGMNDYDVNVRGNTTINGEKMPLIVLDGFPTDFDIKTLNPADIEQITILKDAAAASIWGARAANGVIVIDTKKGKNRQAPVVNVSTSFTTYAAPRFDYLPLANSAAVINYEEEVINKNLNVYNPLTAAPYLQLYKGDASALVYQLRAGMIDSAAYKAERARLSSINGYSQYEDYLLQRANAQNYQLSVSGGNETHSYFFSGAYAKERPTAVGNSGDRFTLTANQSFKVLKKATLDISLKAAIFDYKNNGIGLSKLQNGSSTFLPYNQIVDEEGNKVYYSYKYYQGRTDALQQQGYLNWGYNYLDELHNNERSIKDNNYSGNIGLNIPIYKGLSANGQFMMEKSYQTNRTWYTPESYYARDIVNTATSINTGTGALTYGVPKGGILTQNNSYNTNYSARGQLIYNGNIAGIHQVNAVAGTEIRQTQAGQTINPALYGYNMQTGINQAVSANYVDVNGSTVTAYSLPTGSQDDRTRRFLSYYANAAYTLLDKYSFSGSVRYDDYNNFGVDRKYRATPLWSVGGKWDIGREDWLSEVKWLSSLSLRATYGYNGNLSLNSYPFTYISISNSWFTGLPTASVLYPANPALRWERTGLFNLGLDYAVLDNRIMGTFEWYTKKGTDLLYNFSIDPTYGFNNLTSNNTRINAKGFEASITGAIIRNKDIDWRASFNFSYNRNEIMDTRFVATAATYSSLSGTNIAGYPTNSMWVYKFAGLNSSGMTQVYDADGKTKLDPSKNPSSLDALYYAGTTVAPYYGSMTQTFRYKQFTLFAIGTYSFGGVFRKPTVSTYATTRQSYVPFDLHRDIDKRWRQPGDEAFTNVPGMAGAYAASSLFRYQFSDINVLSSDYIRLREVSLGYELPATVASRITARSINLNFAVRNPGLLWTKNKEGIDPDFVPYLSSSSFALAPSASYTLTLNVGF